MPALLSYILVSLQCLPVVKANYSISTSTSSCSGKGFFGVNGNNVELYCNSGSNTEWLIEYQHSGEYKIQPVSDVSKYLSSDGNNAVDLFAGFGDNQKWRLAFDVSSVTFSIEAVGSNDDKVYLSHNGQAAIDLWSAVGGNQQWIIEDQSGNRLVLAVEEVCPSSWTQLGQRGADIPGAGLVNGNTATSLEDCTTQCASNGDCGAFQWYPPYCDIHAFNDMSISGTWASVLTCKKATYTISTTTSSCSGKGYFGVNGNTVELYCNSGSNTEWLIMYQHSGEYKIQPASDVSKYLSTDGNNAVDLFTGFGDNQKWRLAFDVSSVTFSVEAAGSNDDRVYLSHNGQAAIDLWSSVGGNQQWIIEDQSGVQQAYCNKPNTTGYDLAACASTIVQVGWNPACGSCSDGYTGSALHTVCGSAGAAWSVSGCQASNQWPCADYMADSGCGWTRDWSCPGQETGSSGVAGADGSRGYLCCCVEEMWKAYCNKPNTTGYDLAACASTIVQAGWNPACGSCGHGYTGSVSHTVCGSAGAAWSVSGCQATFVVCAQQEGNTCFCNGMAYFGKKFAQGKPGGGQTATFEQMLDDKHSKKQVNSQVQCDATGFGEDPLDGYFKRCYCEAQIQTSTTTMTTTNTTTTTNITTTSIPYRSTTTNSTINRTTIASFARRTIERNINTTTTTGTNTTSTTFPMNPSFLNYSTTNATSATLTASSACTNESTSNITSTPVSENPALTNDSITNATTTTFSIAMATTNITTITTTSSTSTTIFMERTDVSNALAALSAAGKAQALSTLGQQDIAIVKTASVTVMAVKLKTGNAAIGSDGISRVEATVPGTGVKVAVPTSLLVRLGEDTAAMLTIYSPASLQAALGNATMYSKTGEPIDSVTGIIEFSLTTLAGIKHVVENEPEAILLTLAVNSTDSTGLSMECAFWNQTGRFWSDVGVDSDVDIDGKVVCMATHLSMFGAVAGGFADALMCEDLTMFTSEGLNQIFRGDWWHWPSGIVFFMMVALHIGLFCFACYLDFCTSPWHGSDSHKHFLTSAPIYDKSHVKRSCGEALMDSCHEMQMIFRECRKSLGRYSPCCRILASFFVIILVGCVRIAFSAEHGIHAKDVQKMAKTTSSIGKAVKRRERRSGGSSHAGFAEKAAVFAATRSSTSSMSSRASLSSTSSLGGAEVAFDGLHQKMIDKLAAYINDFALGDVTGTRFASRTWLYFRAMHPMLSITHHSSYESATLRILLLAARIFGCLMLSGVFFNATGNASSKDSPPECDGSNIMMSFAIAVISSAISTLPLLIMFSLHARDMVYIEEADARRRWRMVLKWRIEDCILWIFGSIYTLATIIFTMSFLANVSVDDHWEFLLTSVVSWVKLLVVTPLAIAVFLAAVTTIGFLFPELIKDVRKRMHIPETDVEDNLTIADTNTNMNTNTMSALVPGECYGAARSPNLSSTEGIHIDLRETCNSDMAEAEQIADEYDLEKRSLSSSFFSDNSRTVECRALIHTRTSVSTIGSVHSLDFDQDIVDADTETPISSSTTRVGI